MLPVRDDGDRAGIVRGAQTGWAALAQELAGQPSGVFG